MEKQETTWKMVYIHYGNLVGCLMPKALAKRCHELTGIYPCCKKELKNAMLGYEISLLIQ